jgi:hypothetical protein
MKKAEVMQQKRDVAQIFGGVCYVCGRKYGKGFNFHHKKYIEGEKTYRDFKNPLHYTLYVIAMVLVDPDRFVLLCRKHHISVEMLKRYKYETFWRLIQVVAMSR